MSLKFLGAGNAFAPLSHGQSNAALSFENGLFLIDCGSDCRHLLYERYGEDLDLGRLKGCYLSHVHADHCGGLEWLGFSTLFNDKIKNKPILTGNKDVLEDVWENSLKGGMDTTTESGDLMLKDFFDVKKIYEEGDFFINGVKSKTVKAIHIPGEKPKLSYGLFFENEKNTYYTSDVCYGNWDLNKIYYEKADVIFHDCENTPYKSGVHYHYEDLRKLPEKIRNKIYLYHYDKKYIDEYNPVNDGFLGFVKKGDSFDM